MDYEKLWALQGKTFAEQFQVLCQNSKVWVILTCVKQEHVLYSSWDGRWGSWWVGGWYYQALIGAPSLVHSVGVFVGWNGPQLHWGVWASLTVRLSGAISRVGAMRSAAAVVSITERSLCVSMCRSSSTPAPEGSLKGHVMPPTLDCRARQGWHWSLQSGWDERAEAGWEHGLAEGDGEGIRGIRANIQFMHSKRAVQSIV